MSFSFSMSSLPDIAPVKPPKHQRRTATSVLAGEFDPRPARDALTSLLNGVAPAKSATDTSSKKRDRVEQERRDWENRKRQRVDKGKGRADGTKRNEISTDVYGNAAGLPPSISAPVPRQPHPFWQSTPALMLRETRSTSMTPPPQTPDGTRSFGTSPTSTPPPYTPDDYGLMYQASASAPAPVQEDKPKPARAVKKTTKKGWKGWVEVDEDEEPRRDRLIQLDVTPVVPGERRLRSGKEL